jgi:hypothetical protein
MILFNLLDEIYDPSSELPVADLHEGFGQCHAFVVMNPFKSSSG